MQTRDHREGRLMMARRRLDVANNGLRAAQEMPDVGQKPADRANFIQRAQELVITIEQEVALLSNELNRQYPDADSSYSAGDSL